MAKLTPELKQAVELASLYPLATASQSGMPNVIPIKWVFVENDHQLWLVDNFMSKTLQNLQQNPHASLNVYVAEQDIYIQIKGNTTLETTGDNYQRMRQQMHQHNPDAPAKSLVILNIEEIYQCMPGDTLGQRLDQ